ncbi:hypothetical protein T12_7776 [Trichinella patagoniensis]|uniref:Uncharacterized protein n=1 Tax=Trichinella patagoniensis TaxID=990121 RepID=A0A0V0ZLT2_9BILA|nr:hypothetical protein T12_7776 [Trichinella patagoniensis]
MVTRKKSKKEQPLCPLMEKPWHSVQQRRHFLEVETKNMVAIGRKNFEKTSRSSKRMQSKKSSYRKSLHSNKNRHGCRRRKREESFPPPPKQNCIPARHSLHIQSCILHRHYVLHTYIMKHTSANPSTLTELDTCPPTLPSIENCTTARHSLLHK